MRTTTPLLPALPPLPLEVATLGPATPSAGERLGTREVVTVPAVSGITEVGEAGHLWEAQACVGRGHRPCQLLLLLWFGCPDKHG